MGEVKVVGSELFGTGLAFPSLESLNFRDMSGWKVWSTNGRSGVAYSVFPCLKELYIHRLTDEVWRGVILDLTAVEELVIRRCDEIRYLWESKEAEASSSQFLMNLRNLYVRECKNMVSLGEKDEEEYNYGSNLLTSLSSLVEGRQKLKSTSIIGYKKVLLKEEVELGEGGEKNVLLINTKTMPMLQDIRISSHPNVASIIEFGGNFIRLTTLIIIDCKSTTESDLELQSLTSLTILMIIDCKSMDVPTDGLWPRNLRALFIGNLKKPISE
ncbi:hypothetical protein Tco_1466330 [Tanacetum coccineum]